MINHFSWISKDTSPRLTPEEVEGLFLTCVTLANQGLLNGKFKNPCQVIYWQRLPEEN